MAAHVPGSGTEEELLGLDMFVSDAALIPRTYRFPPLVSVEIMAVASENQHIDKWVPLVVWNASVEMGKALANNVIDVRGKRVLELGSGTGLCGLVAALVSRELCVLTDGAKCSVEALGQSARLNRLQEHVICRQLFWGDMDAARQIVTEFGAFPIVLATDLIYEVAAIEPLLFSALMILEPMGELFLANHKFRFPHLDTKLKDVLAKMPYGSEMILKETRKLGDVDLWIIVKKK